MGKHSIAKELKPIIAIIGKLEFVEKITIANSEGCRHNFAPGSVKLQRKTASGFRMKGFTGNGVQYFYIYIKPIDKIDQVEQKLKTLCKV